VPRLADRLCNDATADTKDSIVGITFCDTRHCKSLTTVADDQISYRDSFRGPGVMSTSALFGGCRYSGLSLRIIASN
jgi:hypothetical protein